MLGLGGTRGGRGREGVGGGVVIVTAREENVTLDRFRVIPALVPAMLSYMGLLSLLVHLASVVKSVLIRALSSSTDS